jgi:glutathione synthase/RimK-type ligase-like ATP-grasp enzyme
MRIALATCEVLPEPDVDQGILLDTLSRQGVEPEMCVWNDDTVEWASYDLCVLRSTWDYYRARGAFLDWLARVDSVTRLQNPIETVRWNSHKGYLVELARQGFHVVPTRFVPAASAVHLHDVLNANGWSEVVVKPAVSASSHETHRVARADLDAGDRHLARLLRRGDVLVQKYLPSVHDRGERALVFIEGELTHTVRKHPRFHGDDESVAGPVPAEPDEEKLAVSLMEGPGRGTLYGRVDLARDPDGRPCLMELELIEPSLFLRQHPEALERFVAAILRRAR